MHATEALKYKNSSLYYDIMKTEMYFLFILNEKQSS